jgi:hypothetical protein
MIDIDPRMQPGRSITLRAVNGDREGGFDLFPPLVMPFQPGVDTTLSVLSPPSPPNSLEADVAE